ncbi:APC family permease [Rathayibacter sp. VKM Ac-2805]|uniref:APC family permease n=1 Tax=Rathayibacter sp. VKM Ac-2805 TaxID=2609258 RepID=UPI00131FF320|nr:APC family permease [Rathayibacter sp. VKM Ac-2805]QHC75121.1 amino acid permease [Rathayibacter sp. VKM Ac-2805]
MSQTPIVPVLGEAPIPPKALERSLGVSGNVLLTLSSISPAASVFILGGAALATYGTGVFWGFLVGGVISLLVALCYAELGSRHPIAGGDYALVSRTLGPASGSAVFFLGLIALPLSQAVFALGVADYMGVTVAGMDPIVTALAVTLVATVVSCLNIRTNAWVTGTFLLVEVVALVLLTALGLLHIERPLTDLLSPQAMNDSGALAPVGIAGLVLVVTQGVFAQFGFGGAVYFAEETRNPRLSIPRAVLWSAVITVVLEVIPLTAVMLGAQSIEGLVGSDLPVHAFLEQRAGHAVAVFVLLSMALAILNANIALSLQAGRLLYVAARDGAMPPLLAKPLSRVSGSAHMPRIATIVMGVVSGVCCLIPMTVLANASGSLVVTGFAFIAVAAIVVRRRPGAQEAGLFRMPLWPLPALVALVVIVAVVGIGLFDPAQWISLGVAAGIVVAGYIYYALYLRPRKGTQFLMLDARDEASAESAD